MTHHEERAATGTTKVGWRMDEWLADSGFKRNKGYKFLRSGRIKAKKEGRTTIIITPPREFLATLSDAAE